MEPFGGNLYERHIGHGVCADHTCVVGGVVVKCHFQAVGAFDYMVVGDDVAVLAQNHARAETARLFLALTLLLTGLLLARGTEKEIEEGIA